jgi:hypothetical protein
MTATDEQAPYLNDVELRNFKVATCDVSKLADSVSMKAHDFSRATLLVKLDEIATRLMEARQAIL